MADFERRALAIEVRAKGRKLEGYAATFGVEARIGAVVETIRRGAFGASLADKRDVLALVDHDLTRVLARTRSGTLRLAEDTRGLAFDLDLPDTSHGRDVLALAERNDLGGMSFAFKPRPGGDLRNRDRRELTAVDLYEISVVQSFPAYEGTVVTARSVPAVSHGADALNVALARAWFDTVGQ
jgi:HK97 family phage prohead protease